MLFKYFCYVIGWINGVATLAWDLDFEVKNLGIINIYIINENDSSRQFVKPFGLIFVHPD